MWKLFKKSWLGRIMFYPDPMDYKSEEVITPREVIKVPLPEKTIKVEKVVSPIDRVKTEPVREYKTTVKRVVRNDATEAARLRNIRLREEEVARQRRFEEELERERQARWAAEDNSVVNTISNVLLTEALIDTFSQPAVVIEPAPYVSGGGGDYLGGGATSSFDAPAPAPEPSYSYDTPAPAPEPSSWSSPPADPPSYDSSSSSSSDSWSSSYSDSSSSSSDSSWSSSDSSSSDWSSSF